MIKYYTANVVSGDMLAAHTWQHSFICNFFSSNFTRFPFACKEIPLTEGEGSWIHPWTIMHASFLSKAFRNYIKCCCRMELTDQRQLCGGKSYITTQQHQVTSLLLYKQFYTQNSTAVISTKGIKQKHELSFLGKRKEGNFVYCSVACSHTWKGCSTTCS